MQVITDELTESDIVARLAAMQQRAVESGVGETHVLDADEPASIERVRSVVSARQHEALVGQADHYRFIRPLASTADTLIEVYQNSDGRIMFGLKQLDMWMRGIGNGELCYITGFAHSGKTQLFLRMVLHNRHRRIVLFTFDEPAELVLTKLVCMRLGWNAEALERRIRENEREAVEAVRRVASQDFAHLLVIDEPLSLSQMTDAMTEARAFFDGEVDAVGIDYLELLRCDETEVEKKSQALKLWTKGQQVPVVCLHQGSRGNSGKGQKITMQSMKYGGEAEAIFVVGVRDLSQDDTLDVTEQRRLTGHVEISLVKNKRPPSKKGEHTYYMEPETGLLRELRPTDGAQRQSAADVIRQRQSTAAPTQVPGQRNFDGEEF